MVRVKHRYLLVQILHPTLASSSSAKPSALDTLSIHGPVPDKVNAGLLTRLIREKVEQLFGDHGAGVVGSSLQIKYFSNATGTFIVRCARAVVRLVWAALTFVRSLPTEQGGGGQGQKQKEVVMQIARVSGTIKKCELEAIRRARELMGRVKGLEMVREAGITLDARGGSAVEENDDVEEEAGVVMADEDDDGDEEDEDDDT